MRKFKKARMKMSRALASDDGLMFGYQSNVAMLLHDRYGITDHDTRNKAAKDILTLIFDLPTASRGGRG